MPIEGFVVQGSIEDERDRGRVSGGARSPSMVNKELIDVYEQIVARGGQILLNEVVPTPAVKGSLATYRQDRQIVVNFPEAPAQS